MPTSIDPATRPALRDEVARSWERVRLTGLRPEASSPVTTTPVDPDGRLVRAARPVLADLIERLDGTDFSLCLGDRAGRLLFADIRTPQLQPALDAAGIGLGTAVTEDRFGNNAIATPLVTGREAWIHGGEHYLDGFKRFSSYGLPIRHPVTRRTEGVVGIGSADVRADPLLGPLLARAVQDVEARLLDGARATDRRLFAAFQRATRRRSVPVAVMDAEVVLANRACLDLLGSLDPSALRVLVPDLSTQVVRILDLGPQGRIQVRAERIDGTVDGVLFQLGSPLPPRFAAAVPEGARGAGRAVHIGGEPGTGRTTAARAAAAGEPILVMEAADAVAGSERGWAARLTARAARHDGVIVVEDVHVLPESLCLVLRRAMATARFVFTSCPVGELPPHVARLTGRCARRVELAPLRERVAELPALIAAMGAAVRPDRDWTITARALDALAAQPWPGNLLELADLVDELAARPAAGRLDLGDLPERYRDGGRVARLGGRERAERAAIILALRGAGGNKVRAAERLGISRTTLYRRMQALEVPEPAVS